MLNKQEIIKKYSELHSYQEVATIYNISRQRVHQIVTGYKTIAGKFHINKTLTKGWGLSQLLRDKMKKKCENCNKQKPKAIHHLDGNPKNNILTNLLAVCTPCHGILHTGKDHRGKYDGQPCLFCKKKMPENRIYNSRGKFCSSTCRNHFKNPNMKFGRKNTDTCIDCGSSEVNAMDRCYNHYRKFWYHNSPNAKEKHAIAMKKYNLKRKLLKFDIV